MSRSLSGLNPSVLSRPASLCTYLPSYVKSRSSYVTLQNKFTDGTQFWRNWSTARCFTVGRNSSLPPNPRRNTFQLEPSRELFLSVRYSVWYRNKHIYYKYAKAVALCKLISSKHMTRTVVYLVIVARNTPGTWFCNEFRWHREFFFVRLKSPITHSSTECILQGNKRQMLFWSRWSPAVHTRSGTLWKDLAQTCSLNMMKRDEIAIYSSETMRVQISGKWSITKALNTLNINGRNVGKKVISLAAGANPFNLAAINNCATTQERYN